MKYRIARLVPMICLALVSVSALADSLNFVSASGGNVGGEDVYPYNFSINGSSSLASLICLNINRSISFGESWDVATASLALDNSQASIDYRADAWIYSQMLSQSASNADGQYAIWSVFDPMDTQNNAGFTAVSATLAQTGLAMAQNQDLIASGFFSDFTLYLPTADQTGWTNGIPQEFLGYSAATTPEPSSLVLLGSGLVGAVASLRRRLAQR